MMCFLEDKYVLWSCLTISFVMTKFAFYRHQLVIGQTIARSNLVTAEYIVKKDHVSDCTGSLPLSCNTCYNLPELQVKGYFK